MSGTPDQPFGLLMGTGRGLGELPEEVREALDAHKDDIRTESDLKRLADDLMLRR